MHREENKTMRKSTRMPLRLQWKRAIERGSKKHAMIDIN